MLMSDPNNIAKILIVVGGFMCYMMADGCTFSIGILYSEFLDVFNESGVSTAIIPALIYSLPQFCAPITCTFVDAFGSSHVALLGGLTLFISIFVSRFVTNLQWIYVTMGIFTSVGLGLTYVSALMAVTRGFNNQKYHGLALGITVSGSGIGVFLFNPCLNYLINSYGWKGALTIESGIFLHIIIAGLLFKLAETYMIFPKENNQLKSEKSDIHIEVITDQENNNSVVNITSSKNSFSVTTIDKTSNEDEKDPHKVTVRPWKPYAHNAEQRSSVFLSMTQTKYCEPYYKPINYQLKSASLDRRINVGDNVSVCLPVDERSASFVRRLSLYSNQNVKDSHGESQDTLSSRPSLLFENSESVEILNLNFTKKIDDQSNTDSILNDHDHSKLMKLKKNLKTSLLSLFSKKVWKNKKLLIFYLISFIFAISVIVVWTFSYNHSILFGIEDTKASFLVSIIGAGSCVGQIGFGFLSEYFPAIILYAIGCFCAGIISIMLVWISNYWALSILHFAFGLSQGVCYSLFSIILLNYNTVEVYPASLGIFLLICGCGNLFGTSMSGYIYDLAGNYTIQYVLGGSLLILCAFIAIPLIRVWRDNKPQSVIIFSN